MFINRMEQQQIVAFYQRVIAPTRVLARIELDWHARFDDASDQLLEHALGTKRHAQSLLVINVEEPGQAYAEIVSRPDVSRFRHVVVCCRHPLMGDRLGPLRGLAAYTRDLVVDAYEGLVDEWPLEDCWSQVTELVDCFYNPLRSVEIANALLDAQLRGVEDLAADAEMRVLHECLRELKAEQLIAVLGMCSGDYEVANTLLGDAAAGAQDWLTGSLLLSGDQPARWARLLVDGKRHAIFESYIPTRAQLTRRWAVEVEAAIAFVTSIETAKRLVAAVVMVFLNAALGHMEAAAILLESTAQRWLPSWEYVRQEAEELCALRQSGDRQGWPDVKRPPDHESEFMWEVERLYIEGRGSELRDSLMHVLSAAPHLVKSVCEKKFVNIWSSLLEVGESCLRFGGRTFFMEFVEGVLDLLQTVGTEPATERVRSLTTTLLIVPMKAGGWPDFDACRAEWRKDNASRPA